jgi:hypothetical protein
MTFVWAIALLVASYVITTLITPKTTNTNAPSLLQDFQFPTTAEGTPKTVIFGDCWSGDWTVLWYGDFDVQPIPAPGGSKK